MDDAPEPDWIRWVESLPRLPAEASSATRMHGFLARLGDPQHAFDAVHIVGTNGKGSVAAMIERIAREGGLRTGLYTSPHLVHYGERVQVDGNALPDDAVGRLVEEVRERITAPTAIGAPPTPTAFDVLTCAAFLHFARERVDLAVVEAGLGGRLDSTNVLPRTRAAVLTSLGSDHAHVLGATPAERLREKLGITHAGGLLASGVDDPQVDARAAAGGARSAVLGRDLLTTPMRETLTSQHATLHVGRHEYADVQIGLVGGHQAVNAALAVAVAEHLGFDEAAIRLGLARVRWPARLEGIVDPAGPATWLLDAAHNPEGIAAVAPVIARLCKGHPVTAILGFSEGRDPATMVAALDALVQADGTVGSGGVTWIASQPPIRAIPATAVADALTGALTRDRKMRVRGRVQTAPGLDDAMAAARASAAHIIVVLGSIYLVGAVRARLMAATGAPPPPPDPVG